VKLAAASLDGNGLGAQKFHSGAMDARTESGIEKAEPILLGAFHYTDESIRRREARRS
jgi:hypothetical protein